MNWQKLKTASLDDILAWAEFQSWCRAMTGCAQDAEWHSEGDVWTHTKMVCQHLRKLDQWRLLTASDQLVLIFTALLHDVAKPATSVVDSETGRVSSPKHAVKGEQVARQVLRDLGCDLATREEICRLVRFHGRPAFLMERDEPVHEVVRLSWLVNNRLLFLFALADTRGRKTDSMSRPEENLHYWKLLAEENNCYDQAFPFANNHARFLFGRSSQPDLHYVPHEDFSCTVTMLSGLPGSGKDTWIAKHGSDLSVMSLDDLRTEMGVSPTDNQGQVVQAARERCREYLRTGESFAFNATNLQRETRQRWIDLFSNYKARIRIVYVEPPFEVIVKQNRDRDSSIPENVIRRLATRYEPPTMWEAHDVVLVGD